MSDIKSHPLDVIQRDTIAKFLLLSKYMNSDRDFHLTFNGFF